jgi:LAGLIDADG DNA endonuclease family protein
MGNVVGSLSEVQHAIVIGSLLGDGSMRCKTNALLEINHSAKQRSYVDWKYRQLADLVVTPPKDGMATEAESRVDSSPGACRP